MSWNWETWIREASTRTVAAVAAAAIIAATGLIWSLLVSGPLSLGFFLLGALALSLLILILVRRRSAALQIPVPLPPAQKAAEPVWVPKDGEGAGITPAELSKLLIKANAFKQRDLLTFYAKKRFFVTGHIQNVQQWGEYIFAVTLKREAGIFTTVYFPISDYEQFKHINDEGWHFEVEAELQPDSSTHDDVLFFHKPTNVRLRPVA